MAKYPASFETLEGVVRLNGEVDFTDPANQPGSDAIPVAAGVGVPGFDFADTLAVGTLYYETAFGGLYLKTAHAWDVSAAVANPLTLPNLGITGWCRLGGDNNGWPVPGISIDGNGSAHLDGIPGHPSYLSDLDAFAGTGNGLYWNYANALDGLQRLVVQTGAAGQFASVLQDAAGNTQFVGIVTEKGLVTRAITAGALPTIALVSGAGAQVLATRDVHLVVSCTFNPTAGAAATVKAEISPDNATYSTLVTVTEPAGVALDGTVLPVSIHVPAGWYVKLTSTNAVIGVGTYY